jgi:UDP-N-acetylmuramoylalanine--D-glutamate ligase
MQDQHVLIFGCGVTGLAAARWCAHAGAQVTVADTRATPPQWARLREEVPSAQFIHMTESVDWQSIGPFTRIVKSPGVPPYDEGFKNAIYLIATNQDCMTAIGELDLFFDGLTQIYTDQALPKMLAITGTNGKTTVTSLLGKLCTAAGLRTAVAGNIGPSLLDSLAAAAAAHRNGEPLPQVWVLELSSYQLHDARPHAFHAATVLNLSEDHLDWHGDMGAYQLAKARIFGGTQIVAEPQGARMVLNRADPRVVAMRPTAKPPKGEASRTVITFGADMPTRAGDFGIEHAGGMDWLVRATRADETRRSRRAAPEEEELHYQRFMPAAALRIFGRHNACNALAALALASTLDAPLAPMLYALREYRGEPHRVASVAVVGDVEYIDDSKGTNVGATLAAIDGLSARKLVLILGGDGKGQDFSPLAGALGAHARAVALIGRDAATIENAVAPACNQRGVPVARFDDLEAAVRASAKWAHAGDAVLLSPACASTDMFQNYAHRGQVFAQAVAQLGAESGVAL